MATQRTDTDLAKPIPTPYRLQIPIAYEDRDMIASRRPSRRHHDDQLVPRNAGRQRPGRR